MRSQPPSTAVHHGTPLAAFGQLRGRAADLSGQRTQGPEIDLAVQMETEVGV